MENLPTYAGEILDTAEDGFAVLDSQFRFVYASAGAERLLGKSSAELLGRTKWELFPGAAGTIVEREYRRALAEGVQVRFENYCPPLRTWYEVRARPARDGSLLLSFRDITAEKTARTQAEQLLREVEAERKRFEAVVSNVPVAIAILRAPEYVCELRNPAMAALAPGKPMLGQTVAQVFPEVADRLLPLLESVRQTGEARHLSSVQARIRRAPGAPTEDAWFDASFVPLDRPAGEIETVLVAAFEVTSQIKVQRELAERAAQLDAVIESITLGISFGTRDGITRCNRNWYVLLGGSSEADVQYPASKLGTHFHVRRADTGELLAPDQLAFVRALRGETIIEEQIATRLDGTDVRLEVTAAPVVQNGAITGAVLTFSDVTERWRMAEALRLSEERRRLAVEAAGLGLWSWDMQTDQTDATDQYNALFGMAPGSGLGLGAFLDTVHPADRDRVNAAIRRSLETRGGHEVEYRIVWADGSVHWIHTKGRVQTDATGRPTGIQGVCLSIDDRKRDEAALLESRQRLQLAISSADLLPWEFELQSRTTTAGEADCALFGCTEPGLEDWAARIHPEDRARAVEAFFNSIESGHYEDEYRVNAPDGVRWLQSTGTVIREADGRPVRMVGVACDITRRKLAEVALRESEQRYRAIVESTQEGVWILDDRGVTLFVSNRMSAMLGYTPAEMLGHSALDFLFEEDRVSWCKKLEAVLRDGGGNQVSRRYRRKDGSELLARVNASRISYGDNPSALLGMVTDVTAHLQARRERERLHTLLETLVANSPVCIGVLRGPEFRYALANPAILAYAGRDDLVGKTIAEIFPEILVDGRHRNLDTVFRSGKPLSIREMLLTLRGEPTYWNAEYVPIPGPAGDTESILIISQEVTEIVLARKRAEELAAEAERRAREAEEGRKALEAATARFRRLIDAGIIGIAVASERRILEANDAFLKIIGYERADLERGLSWTDLTAPEYRHLDARGIRELRQSGTCTPYEKRYIRKDGSRVPVLIGASTLTSSPDLEWICFVLDLTERDRIDEQLRQTQRIESIGLLAGGIAHDFNNILTGMLGNASLLLHKMPPSDVNREHVSAIVQAGERAADLTRQLLAYAGKGRFIITSVDLSRTVSEMLQLLRASIPATVQIDLDLAARLPAIEADAAQMQQVIMNLVINAAEALGGEPGNILVRTFSQTLDQPAATGEFSGLAPGVYAAVEVHDTGCGMDPATLARIFDPFFTTKFTGRGLGLAAVQGIVKAHKGAIRVSSRPGKGSSFLLLFPAQANKVRNAVPRPAVEDLVGEGTVLVVDDEAGIREVARAALEQYGYTVLSAGSGAEAIYIFERQHARISVVLLDMTMPGVNGEDTVKALREIDPGVRVLLSSGYGEVEAQRRFGRLGISGFIPKPYTATALAVAVKAACTHPPQAAPAGAADI